MKNKIFALTLLFMLIFTNFYTYAIENPQTTATNALLIHLGTGITVYEKNSTEKTNPAGANKIMTAILAIEKAKSLDETVTAKPSAFKGVSTISSAKIKPNEVLTVRDLLYCVIVASSNEACNILAEYVSEDVSTFIALMNNRAKELGATNTLFTNTTGVYDAASYSTAVDISKITLHAIKLSGFMDIANATTYKMPKTNLSDERILYTKNEIILKTSPNYISYVEGIKTAATAEGGYSLISLGDKKIGKKNEQMLCIVLGCPKTKDGAQMVNAYADTKILYNWVYSTYKLNKLIKQDDPITEAKIGLAEGKDFALLVAQDTVETLMPSDFTPEKLEKIIKLPNDINAPIEKGQVLGEVILKFNGIEYGKTKLLSQNAIKRNTMLFYTHQLNLFFSNIWVKITTGLILTLFILYIVYTVLYNKKRNRQKAIKRRIKF